MSFFVVFFFYKIRFYCCILFLYQKSSTWPLRPIYVTLHPIFKIFSLSFDVDCKEVPLLIDLQCSEDLKSKFLACHILNFCKNQVFPSRWFPYPIITSSKEWAHLALHTTDILENKARVCYICNYKIITCFVCLFCQSVHFPLILHLFVIENIRCFINKLWSLSWESNCFFWGWGFWSFKIVALGPPELSFVALRLKMLGSLVYINKLVTKL